MEFSKALIIKKITLIFFIWINVLLMYGQPITLTDGSASLTLSPGITGTGCGPNAGFDPGNGIDQLFALDWYISIEGGQSINFSPANRVDIINDNTIVANYALRDISDVFGNLGAILTITIKELSPFDVQITQVMELSDQGSIVGELDVKLYSYVDLDKNDERTEDATIYLEDECNFITEIRNSGDPSQVCYYAVNASDGYEILPNPNLCENLLAGITDLNNIGLPLNEGDYTQAVQFNAAISFLGFRTCETILTFGNPPEPAIVDERSGQCTFPSTPDPNFTYAQPIQICNEDGSFMLKIDISQGYYGGGVLSDFVYTETNIPGISPVFASYYYYEGEVIIGPYPAGASWNIEVNLYYGGGPLLTTYTGTSTDCAQEVDCSSLTANLQASCEPFPDSNDVGYITTLSVTGGDGNYTITGDVNQVSDSFIDPTTITDGSIDVTIGDGNGCIIEVSEPVSACPPEPDCSTLSADLSVDCITTDGPPFVYLYATFLTITGGDGNYTITGDVNNAGVDNIDPATITDGSIDVTIEDGNGCTIELSEPVSDCPEIDCSTLVGDLQVICEPQRGTTSVAYSVELTVSGGDGNYTISGDVNRTGISLIGTQSILDGSIDVVVEDGNGCIIEVSTPAPECEPNCAALNADIEVTCNEVPIADGTFEFVYQVNLSVSGAGDIDDFTVSGDLSQSAESFIDPATITDGSIDATIEDRNGCIVEVSVPVSACPEIPETCPASTDLGVFDCTNIDQIPTPPANIEEAMALPYNIQFNDATELTKVTTIDSDPIFYCEDNARTVTRTVIIYEDVNLNCAYDPGEELESCDFEISTVPDISAPVFTAPSTTGTTCSLGWDPSVTGTVLADDDCPLCGELEVAYSDSLIPAELVIVRTWAAIDYCGNLFEQEQLIFIDDAENCIDELNSLVMNSPSAPCSILDVDLQVSCESFPCEETPDAYSFFGYAVEFSLSPCFGDYSITGDLNRSVAGGFEPIIITEFIDPSIITDGSVDVVVEDRNGCIQEVSVPVSACPPVDCSTLTADLQATCVLTPLISGEFIPEYEVILSISGGNGNYAISGDVDQAGQSVILATTITDGSIDVIIEDGNGCIIEVSEPVSDCPEIDCSTLSADLQVTCSDDFIEYIAALVINGGDGNYSISGDLSSIGTSSIDPTTITDGSIDVVVEDGNGCILETNFAAPECASPALECEGVEAVSTKITNMDRYIKHLNRWSKYLPAADTPIDSLNKN